MNDLPDDARDVPEQAQIERRWMRRLDTMRIARQPALRLMIILIVALIAIETFEMMVLLPITHLSPLVESLIDSTILVLASSPVLYFFVIRPLMLNISERKRVQAALNATRDRLDFLLSTSPAVIYTSKPEGDYGATFISENVTSQLGYEPRDFTADPNFWANHIHPKDTPRILAGLRSLFELDRHVHEYRFQRKDGTYRWMRDELRLVRDAAGNPEEIIGCWIDISSRREVEEQLQAAHAELEERVAQRTEELELINHSLNQEISARTEAEESLRQSEEHFRSLIENSSDIITVLDLDGTIRYASPSLQRVLGYEPNDLIGSSAFDLVHANDLPSVLAEFAHLVEYVGAHRSVEFRFRHADGSWCTLEAIGKSHLEGSRPVIVVNSRDITERKAAEHSLRKVSMAVEQAAESVLITDQKGIIEYVNPAFETLTGYSRDDTVGERPSIVKSGMHPASFYHDLWQTITSGNVFSAEFTNRKKDGTLYFQETTITPIRDGQEITHFIQTARDVTDRKRAEEERNRLLSEREGLIQRNIEAYEDERRKVAYDIHDGPAQQIVGADLYLKSYLAERRRSEEPEVEKHLWMATQYLGSAIQETRRIMSDLRPPALDDFGLVEALRQYFEEFAQRTGLKVDYQTNARGTRLPRTTETALFRIAQEAASNAAKHSGSDTLTVSLRRKENACVLEVADPGVGFNAAGSKNGGFRSQHVGLIGMRERSELVGAEFNVESAPDRGTTITVEVPIEKKAGGREKTKGAKR